MLHNYIGTEHILLGLMREEKSVAAAILAEKGMRLGGVREDIVQLLNEKANVGKSKETPLLSEFSRDLTEAAARGALDPLVGRGEELARIIQVLCRRTRNNPVLIGEPGVGKTALVEGLANKIVQGDVPIYLADKRILALDISLIVAGTKYRGQFEERLKTIMRELTESRNIVIFIDELHTLVGAGSAEGSLDAANILKPALSRGEIQCIGATTPAEYRKYIEKDRSLERRFQAVKVAPPSEDETVEILRGIKDRYEKFHHVAYRDEALEAAVFQSNRYITDRFLPDKAIDLLDEAGSRVKLRDAQALEDQPEFSRKIRVVVDRSEPFERALLSRRGGGAAREPHHRPRALGHGWQRRPRGDEGGHRRRRVEVDRDPDHGGQGRGIDQAAAHGRGSAQAHRLAGQRDQRRGPGHPAHARRAQEPKPARGLVHLPRPDRRGEDRGGAQPRGAALRLRAEPGALRHVRVHGEALGLEADRLTSRLRRARRGGPAHRAGQAQSVFSGAAGRDREGASRRLQHPASGLRGRAPHGWPRQHHRLQEHDPDHDLQHRRPLHREARPDGLHVRRGTPDGGGDLRAGDGRGEAHLQPRVHQPHRRDHRLRGAHRGGSLADHSAARGSARREPEGQGHHAADPGRRASSGSWRRRCRSAPTARGPCAARSSVTSKMPCPKPSSADRSGPAHRSRSV